jgi:4a-hydroxytetrahydrobiopterin dehydratase
MAEIWGKLLYIHNPAELSMITKSGSACFRSLGRFPVKWFVFREITKLLCRASLHRETGGSNPMPQLLRPEAVENLLGEVPNWKLRENSIERTFKFSGFQEAIDFVNRVAQEAENMNHHPDIDIRWNKVKLVLSTHSAGGLTNNDFMLATKVDKLA